MFVFEQVFYLVLSLAGFMVIVYALLVFIVCLFYSLALLVYQSIVCLLRISVT